MQTHFFEEQKMCLEINFLCKESPTSDFVQELKKRSEREKNLNGDEMKDFFSSPRSVSSQKTVKNILFADFIAH